MGSKKPERTRVWRNYFTMIFRAGLPWALMIVCFLAFFLLAMLGGAPGGLLGLYAFRHKPRHPRFLLGFWALALLQLGALGYCAYRYM